MKTTAAAFAVALVPALVVSGVREAGAVFPGTNGKLAFSSTRATGAGVDNLEHDLEIFATHPDGGGIEQLTSNKVADSSPAWSPDGRWVAWNSEVTHRFDEIYVRSSCGCANEFVQTLRLTTNAAFDGYPAFSPSGQRLAFHSDRDGNSNIYVMDAADSNPADGNGDNRRQLTEHPLDDRTPVWSPDGTKIAFQSSRDGNAEIYMMNAADGTDPINLTNNPAGDFDPAFSPDGKKVAFLSYGDGAGSSFGDIYVMKAGRPESKKNRPKQITEGFENAREPDWRPIPLP